MSHKGKILRGKKWYSFKDNKGELPEDISLDPEKMKDVNYYLEDLSKDLKPITKVISKEKKVK